jgi:hypothetical protein
MTTMASPRAWLLLLPLLLAGCREPQITYYTVPKERPAADRPAGRPTPEIEWQLPEGWTRVEGRVGVATFAIFGEGGRQAQVNITPLPPMQGREALIINMWRSQVGLGEIPEAEAAGQLTDVPVGSETGRMFEVANAGSGGEGPQRIVTAMVHRAEASWFYKLSGDDALVQAEKPRFLEFLQSIRIKETAGTAAGTPAAPATPAASFRWQVPAGWTALPPGQMQDARFAVPAQDGGRAEVSVSVFASPTGTTLLNVNRWRGQIGLPPITEAELPQHITPLDPARPDAILLDVTNNNQRLLAAVFPRQGRHFFYKLLGDTATVAAQREAFVQFVKSEP